MNRRYWILFSALSLGLSVAMGCASKSDPEVERARENTEQATREVKKEVKQEAQDVKTQAKDLGQKVGEQARKLEVETRDSRAKLAENARVTAEKLKEGTEKLGKQAAGVAQGISEGWKEGDAPININSASQQELLRINGLGQKDARKIVAGRPYSSKKQLLERKIISAETYVKIEDKITTN